MKKIHQLIFLGFVCVVLGACAMKNKTHTQSAYIVLKTPQIKFADYGFLNKGSHLTKLEFYNASKVLFELKITDQICINSVCYAKKKFNQRFFNNAYYEDFLEDIIHKKPIFYGKNKKNHSCGFSQKISSKNYDISYEVCDESINFSDIKNKIKLSIKPI
ncbi:MULTISPECIES: hypothetical protein [unclassified Campylobacter]|uniref:hypothetical protein n=1 Tax=unclassified Campylobacter TaxID=2593542 RepID=UPI000EA9B51E|nr:MULTISPECIES: hypothetical protein [unclassified Campylobacter]QOR01173.1 hypothetical protein A0083_00015 [Campylobacter sp. 2014D-0216]RKO64408.1 hypothetical protein CKA54_05845 [Campylobacter sp. P255]